MKTDDDKLSGGQPPFDDEGLSRQHRAYHSQSGLLTLEVFVGKSEQDLAAGRGHLLLTVHPDQRAAYEGRIARVFVKVGTEERALVEGIVRNGELDIAISLSGLALQTKDAVNVVFAGRAMETSSVWMLLTVSGSQGVATPLVANIDEGTHGQAIRHIELPHSSADIRESAKVGTQQAYTILYREKYLDRQITTRFESSADLTYIHGRSADLAFALAFVVTAMANGQRGPLAPPLAATGVLSNDGGIGRVDGIDEKLAAALMVLPPGALFIFPGHSEPDLSRDLRQQAAARGITLFPAFRLEKVLQHIGIAISRTWLESPFRGLEPFAFEHASIFFGRETEIADILALLRRRATQSCNALLVTGPSGSGKSSLVLAGVVPALLRRGVCDGDAGLYRWGSLRPRDVKADIDPARERRALAEALHASWLHNEEGGFGLQRPARTITDELDADMFLAWLKAHSAEAERTRYVWVLDQMEEWFTSPLQPATVKELCNFLAQLAERGVWLIATLTNSADPLLAEHSSLAACFGVEGRYVLGQKQGAASLEAVIREPAKAAGLRFETGLEAEIFAAASHGGDDVLPLIELLLTELYERRDQTHNELRIADYRDVGGLDGIISTRAESVFNQCSNAEKSMMPALLWKLGTAGKLIPSEYATESPMHALLAAFQRKRLLVQDQSALGYASVRAAHGALLRHWPRAVEQRGRDENNIRLWLDLNREAGQWARGERSLIPSGPQLDAAQSLCKRRASDLTAGDAPVLDFIRAALNQRTRRRIIVAVALGVPAMVAGGFGIRAGFDYFEDLHLTRINFADIPVPGPDYVIAAAPYLQRFGVAITAHSPDNSKVVIRSNVGLYEGQAADLTSTGHFLTQEANPATAPIGFELSFDRPVKAVRVLRAPLWAATKNGVTHPSWTAHAYNAAGTEIAMVHEDTLAAFHASDKVPDVPATWHVLADPDGQLISSVRIISDFRDPRGCHIPGYHPPPGCPFAGFQAVLISEIHLVH